MSDTDSFIDEVTEEVRRDKLYALLRRYGWIGVVVVLLAVGGTAWTSWQREQTESAAQALGDGILGALESGDAAARAQALGEIEVSDAGASAMRDFLRATAELDSGDAAAAQTTLRGIEANAELPLIYRQLAGFKALTIGGAGLDADARRAGFEAMAAPGNPMRLLAEEQLALLDIEAGQAEAAITRLQAIIDDAETTQGLQQRAVQVIVALGGEPDLTALRQNALGHGGGQ